MSKKMEFVLQLFLSMFCVIMGAVTIGAAVYRQDQILLGMSAVGTALGGVGIVTTTVQLLLSVYDERKQSEDRAGKR